MKKVLFIHRSVGHHLLQYGKLRDLLNSGAVELDDYDNNNGLLTRSNGKVEKNVIQMPGNNTNPDNLADFFASWATILDDYDLIIFKSCYPNSHIKNEAQLDEIKNSYNNILQSFKEHDKDLVIITTPPLRPLSTNSTEAKLASDLAKWLVGLFQDNVMVFDLHHLYSEAAGKYAGMLKQEYRRLLPWDNHPNAKAHQTAAPILAKLIVSKLS